MNKSLTNATSVITQGIADGLHIGAQIYVSHRGQIVMDAAFGESRPGVAMTIDTLMPWLSSGKPITAAGIAMLWQRGLLMLDDPVARYIPEFAGGGKDAITIRHCLTHTAGIRTAVGAWSEGSWRDIIARICDSSIEAGWTPGKSAGYHIASTWYLLGEIISRITNQEPGEFLRNEILLPLKMNDSWFGMPAEVWQNYGDRIAQMQITDITGPRPQSWERYEMFSFARPAANARGPVRDLGKFYESLLPPQHSAPSTQHFLNPQTIEAITTPKRVGVMDQTFKAKIDWALGFICNSSHYGQMGVPYQFGSHASPRAFGHAGNQSSIGMADPEHGLVIAVVFNGMPGDAKHDRRMRQLLGGIYEDLSLT